MIEKSNYSYACVNLTLSISGYKLEFNPAHWPNGLTFSCSIQRMIKCWPQIIFLSEWSE